MFPDSFGYLFLIIPTNWISRLFETKKGLSEVTGNEHLQRLLAGPSWWSFLSAALSTEGGRGGRLLAWNLLPFLSFCFVRPLGIWDFGRLDMVERGGLLAEAQEMP